MKVAIIPARGGSKRIPGKNIRDFAGKPMIAWSIEAAREAGVFDEVLVSTDDEAIAAVARQYGATTPFFRPADLADDHATTVPVIRHAIQHLSEEGYAVADVCCLYATAPFVRAEDLREAYHQLQDQQVSGYVFSAATMPFPFQRSFAIDDQGYCRMFYPECYAMRSQDLPVAYQDAGQFYWGRAESFLEGRIFFSTDSKPYVIPRFRVQDIDTLEDWEQAELLFHAQHSVAHVRRAS